MKSVVILLVSAAAIAGAGAQNKLSAAEEAAVREVVKQYVDARERRDASAIRALFTEDADQLTSSGEWRRGREEVVKGSLASSAANTGTRTITVEAVRFPASGTALVDGAYSIAAGGGTRNMRTSFVMIRAGTSWRIAAIRNMLPATAQSRR